MNEFKSQICTSVEQSKRLLDLGLKPETADMVLFKSYDLPQYPFDYTFNQDPNALVNCSYVPMVKGNQPYIQDGNIPAWSLHRLMEIGNIEHTGFSNINNAYDTCISMIASHIKFGLLNKEYLNL